MADEKLTDLRKESTKQGPKMDYSGMPFPKPSSKKKTKKGWGKKK